MVNSLRNNLSSLQARNYLNDYNKDLSKTYSNISSGLHIVHPKDDSAKFVTSEQLRTRISDITQAQKNTDNAISMIQLSESGLNEINQLLINMRRVAIHSSNDAINNEHSLSINQTEIDDSIQELDRILSNLHFGKRSIYKTESGTNGTVSNEKIEFIAANENTLSSGVDGYAISINNMPTASSITALRKLNEEEILTGDITFKFITEKGNYSYNTYPNQSNLEIVHEINELFSKNSVLIQASINDKDIISFTHKKLGSKPSFKLTVNSEGLFSKENNDLITSSLGSDVEGTIGGETFKGEGSKIYGKQGGRTEGLVLHYNIPYEIDSNTKFDTKGRPIIEYDQFEEEVEEYPIEVSRIFVDNKSLTYHAGNESGEIVKFHLPEINSSTLSRHITNSSGFNSLNEIKVTNFEGAQNSIALINNAIDEITVLRGQIGSFQKNLLEQNQIALDEKKEQVIGAESKIRDTDMALATLNLARQQLSHGAATEALRSSNIRKADILRLFKN